MQREESIDKEKVKIQERRGDRRGSQIPEWKTKGGTPTPPLPPRPLPLVIERGREHKMQIYLVRPLRNCGAGSCAVPPDKFLFSL